MVPELEKTANFVLIRSCQPTPPHVKCRSAGQHLFLRRCFVWEPSRSFFGVAKNRHIGVENLLPPYTEWCKTAYFMKSGARHHRSPSKTWHRIESLCHVQESTCCRDWKGFCLIRVEEVVYFIWEKRGESRSLFVWASSNVFVNIPYNNIVLQTLRITTLLYKHWE